MLNDFRPIPGASSAHITVFAERYNQLLAAARSLGRDDQGQAIDLVHDALIEFVRYSPDLHKINNLDGYLCRLMCNLFKLQKRKAMNRSMMELSIENYDSVESVLTEAANQRCDPQHLLHIQDVLRTICEYACFRKERLKLGSVLILRYFHGYHTSEIALIMGVTSSAVSHQLKLAQAEINLYLNDPKQCDFYREIASLRGKLKLNHGCLADDLMSELRRAIFLPSSCRGCILHFNLYKLYSRPRQEGIDCKTLAHIVSCADCLNAISNFLGLDLPSMRYPMDELSRRTKGREVISKFKKALKHPVKVVIDEKHSNECAI